jgi:hypothetical protein
MRFLTRALKPLVSVLAAVCVLVLLSSCKGAIDEKHFVGKWRSTRLATPVYLHANGEWEIKTDEGGVLQYGVWKVKGSKITWSYKIDSQFGHDWDPILSSTPREFRVKEDDGTITTFTKLD